MFRRILLIGVSGSGKTTLAGSAPGQKLFLDFDCQAGVSFDEDRYGKDIFYYPLFDPPVCKKAKRQEYKPSAYTRAEELLFNMYNGKPYTFEMPGHDKITWEKPPDWLIVDSLSTLEKRIEELACWEADRTFKKRTWDEYGAIARGIDRIISSFFAIPCNIIFTAHHHLETKGDSVEWVLDRYGKNKDASTACNFTEVWRLLLVTDKSGQQKRVIQTVANEEAFAKTKLNLKPFEPFTKETSIANFLERGK